MSKTNRSFLLGVLFGVAIIPVGMLGGILGLPFMNVISQVFATPGVVLSLPLHNLVPPRSGRSASFPFPMASPGDLYFGLWARCVNDAQMSGVAPSNSINFI